MRNAAAHRMPAQVFEHLIDRPPDMQQYRQVEFLRQFQLFDEEKGLALGIESADVIIQPDLAHRDRLFSAQPVAQHGKIIFFG